MKMEQGIRLDLSTLNILLAALLEVLHTYCSCRVVMNLAGGGCCVFGAGAGTPIHGWITFSYSVPACSSLFRLPSAFF